MNYEHLFQPFKLGAMELKNRIVMAPMTRGRAGKERVANDLMAEYYEQRAGAGLIITEATVVSEEGIGWIDSPGIYSEEMAAGWKKVTKRVKKAGAPMILQLWHCGRASHSDFHGRSPVSASSIRIDNGDKIHTPQGKKDYEIPRELDAEDIKQTIADFKQAAEYARAADFAGVEIHAANGYLINQFLDSKTNQRKDSYGGSLGNRFRFLKEIIENVLEIFPPEKVGVRLSPNGVFNDMGSEDFRETYLYVADKLNDFKLAYLHVMDGLAFGFHKKGEPMTLAEFRKVFNGPIIGNCGYSADSASERIAAGDADLIAIGRPFISNPDLPERYQKGLPLAAFDDMSKWYSPGPEGYTDYEKAETADRT